MKRLALISVLFFIVSFVSCDDGLVGPSGGGGGTTPPPIGDFNSIDGMITLKGASNHSGATVTLGGSYSTTTNSTGFYRLRDFPNGTYYLTISKVGYQTHRSPSNWVFTGASHYRYDATLQSR